MVSTYLGYQFYTQDLTKTLQRIAAEPQVAREAQYYQANIGTVKSVDDFLANTRLFTYAMKAYGLEDMTYAKAFMKKVLESDLSDSKSFANQLSDSRYRDFAQAFNFTTDGTLQNSAAVQADDQEAGTTDLYTQKNADAATATEQATTYFEGHIGAVTSVDDLLANGQLYSYALKSVGLDPTMMSSTVVRSALTSDLSDPTSVANKLGHNFLTLAELFNFGTDGSVMGSDGAQNSSQTNAIVSYYSNQSDAGVSDSQASLLTQYYQNNIGSVKSVDDLLKNNTLYNYVLTAYGLDPSTVSQTTIRKALESDLSDKNSYANTSGDSRLKDLAAAFNFAADGSVATRRMAQSIPSASATVALYGTRIASDVVSQNAAKAETTYYEGHIGEVRTLDDLLNDTRLTAYIVKAYGADKANLSKSDLRQILTSDLSDPNSYANRLGYHDLAAAFNFATDGTIERDAPQQAQSSKNAITTADDYVRQTMETEAGDTSEGVRLALYFARKAPTITSAYSILGDKALLQVVRTALGISDTTGGADIDVQAAMIEKRLNISDLQDPDKLNKFLVRFSALYDMNNDTSSTSPTSILFGGQQDATGQQGVIGFDPTLIASFQSVKIGL